MPAYKHHLRTGMTRCGRSLCRLYQTDARNGATLFLRYSCLEPHICGEGEHKAYSKPVKLLANPTWQFRGAQLTQTIACPSIAAISTMTCFEKETWQRVPCVKGEEFYDTKYDISST